MEENVKRSPHENVGAQKLNASLFDIENGFLYPPGMLHYTIQKAFTRTYMH